MFVILWLAPIPVGLFTGRLHLTWGNLSFDPHAKRSVVALGAVIFLVQWLAIRVLRRADRRDRAAFGIGRTGPHAAIFLTLCLGTAWQAAPSLTASWWSAVLELVLLTASGESFHRATGAAATVAAMTTTVWLSRIAVFPFADGPFEGIGMIVTTPAFAAVSTLIWPLALTAVVIWRTRSPRRRG